MCQTQIFGIDYDFSETQRSLLKVDDSFKKIIIVWDSIKGKVNEQGILTISLLDFLLNTEVINKLL